MIKFSDYRTKYFALNNNRVCEKCWTAKYLQVHHINKHHSDNRLQNLMLVCWKCHRELHKWERIYKLMPENHPPYRPNIKKRMETMRYRNICWLRTVLKNRIHNATKSRLERIYFGYRTP